MVLVINSGKSKKKKKTTKYTMLKILNFKINLYSYTEHVLRFVKITIYLFHLRENRLSMYLYSPRKKITYII